MLPNFIGIGAPKAATTWLYRCLREHPEVFVARQKELNILHYDSFDGDLSAYEAHFAAAGAAKAIGEISVRYLDSHNAPMRVAKYLPRARLFVSVRDPVAQVYSHYWHLKRQDFHQPAGAALPESFDEALRAFPHLLVEPARYGRHLSRWLQHVDRSQLLVLVYDDILASPLAQLRRLFAHLGVAPDFVPDALHLRDASVREGTSPRSAAAERLERFLYGWLARGLYGRLKALLGVRRAASLKDALRARELMEAAFRRPGYPPMAARDREQLRALFHDDVRVLGELAGRDLSGWA